MAEDHQRGPGPRRGRRQAPVGRGEEEPGHGAGGGRGREGPGRGDVGGRDPAGRGGRQATGREPAVRRKLEDGLGLGGCRTEHAHPFRTPARHVGAGDDQSGDAHAGLVDDVDGPVPPVRRRAAGAAPSGRARRRACDRPGSRRRLRPWSTGRGPSPARGIRKPRRPGRPASPARGQLLRSQEMGGPPSAPVVDEHQAAVPGPPRLAHRDPGTAGDPPPTPDADRVGWSPRDGRAGSRSCPRAWTGGPRSPRPATGRPVRPGGRPRSPPLRPPEPPTGSAHGHGHHPVAGGAP